MLNYLIRRVLIGSVTLLAITAIIYALIRQMPGSPITLQLSEADPSKSISEEDFQRMRAMYGLDKPVHIAYFDWLGSLLQGDLGRSISRKQPVTKLIGERLGPTLLLSVPSLLLTYLLAVPIGLFSVARSHRPEERCLSTLLYMLYSLPTYVAALLLLVLFAKKLQGTSFELPLFGMTGDEYANLTPWRKLLDIGQHMILPVTCYTYSALAFMARFIKSNMEEVIRQDYIRTARAKGVSNFGVIVVHAFRNTLIPFVTELGLTLPGLLSGSVILEQIFTWPGIGRLFFEAIGERDYPTIMGLTLMFSLMTLVFQLLADILYAFVDPRVTYH
ncbi:MAG: ABC transporter permease [Planctomycetota bacterium]|nr:ABC transporter permease [Planctomycetota bacterium]